MALRLVNGVPRGDSSPRVATDSVFQAFNDNPILLSGVDKSYLTDTKNIVVFIGYLSCSTVLVLKGADGNTVITLPAGIHNFGLHPLRFDGGVSYTGTADYLYAALLDYGVNIIDRLP